MDTHFTAGGVIVIVMGLVLLAILAIYYQWEKRNIARHKAELAVREASPAE